MPAAFSLGLLAPGVDGLAAGLAQRTFFSGPCFRRDLEQGEHGSSAEFNLACGAVD